MSKGADRDAVTVKAPLCACGECRKCRGREKTRRWRTANADAIRARARARYAADPEPERARQRAWRDANLERSLEMERASKRRRRDKIAESDRRRREVAREKVAARAAVNNAIQAGRLVRQPCETCGARAQAHHDDYSKPLDVRWLCARHHADLHVAERRAA